MNEEEYQDNLATLAYFWREKRDIGRWIGWVNFKEKLASRDPVLYAAIMNYDNAERLLDRLLK